MPPGHGDCEFDALELNASDADRKKFEGMTINTPFLGRRP